MTGVALLYDHLLVGGGAENVTLLLARSPRIDKVIVASMDRRRGAVHPKLRAILPWAPRGRVLRGICTLSAFALARHVLRGCGAVIYSGHYAIAAPRPRGAYAIYYCHALPLGAALASASTWWLRLAGRVHDRWLARKLHRMDRVVANSEYCAAEYRKLGIAVHVLRPPADHSDLHWAPSEGYFLSLARHEPSKRVDRIISAFRQMPTVRLVVAAGGSQTHALTGLAADAPNIDFLGNIDRSRLARLIAGAVATIHVPTAEALGLVVFESLAAGKPVIANGASCHTGTVFDGVNGIVLGKDPTPEEIAAAVRQLSPRLAASMRDACLATPNLAGPDAFIDALFQPGRRV